MCVDLSRRAAKQNAPQRLGQSKLQTSDETVFHARRAQSAHAQRSSSYLALIVQARSALCASASHFDCTRSAAQSDW
jgi:hypothetical protein